MASARPGATGIVPVGAVASRRRRDLLELLDRLHPTIEELSQAIEPEAERCPEAQRLMTHPGVGPLSALATVLVLGSVTRFPTSRHVASYIGLAPAIESSAGKHRLGRITKQGNALLRYVPGHAGQAAIKRDPPNSISRGDLFHCYLRHKFVQQRRRIVLPPD